ncbi:MAG: hypothetical protein WAV54_14715 [Acidimicrobiales bacterium]
MSGHGFKLSYASQRDDLGDVFKLVRLVPIWSWFRSEGIRAQIAAAAGTRAHSQSAVNLGLLGADTRGRILTPTRTMRR